MQAGSRETEDAGRLVAARELWRGEHAHGAFHGTRCVYEGRGGGARERMAGSMGGGERAHGHGGAAGSLLWR